MVRGTVSISAVGAAQTKAPVEIRCPAVAGFLAPIPYRLAQPQTLTLHNNSLSDLYPRELRQF